MTSIARVLLLTGLSALAASAAAASFTLIQYRQDAKSLAQEFGQRLRSELTKEIAANGPVSAIKVCKELAPAIADELSHKGMGTISRVSLKNRNPTMGKPDAWESGILSEFEQRLAAGEKIETLEAGDIVTVSAGEMYRYMKAIPTMPLCLTCHGKPEQLAPQIREALASLYPADLATGYTVGQIRGAFSVKRVPEYTESPVTIEGQENSPDGKRPF